jgi:hypothetical protein
MALLTSDDLLDIIEYCEAQARQAAQTLDLDAVVYWYDRAFRYQRELEDVEALEVYRV